MCIGDNNILVTTEPKTFYFDLPVDANNNSKHEIYSIIRHNELLAGHTMKDKIRQLLSNYKHGNDIHEH